ncbi:head GIN domain-containing protein [Sunxiuqinia sp. A32]|uniref:head GIN domain-containing protein n=1 Tax=Sunxiuqinia sp. A32 TaxID=3461496 RepID=UPI0040453C2E
MKTFKLFTIALALLIGSSAFAMQEKSDEQVRNVKSFHAIKVSSGIDLYLTQGNSEKVVINADPDIIDDIITEVRDGVLHIYLERNFNWGWNNSRKAHVTFDDLEALNASAGSDVYSENSFNLNELKIHASSGSDVKLTDLKAKEIWLETSSGSDAKLSGQTDSFEASASSGSDIDAGNLESKYCKVRVSSGSDATVFVTENLKANASSGGDIRYRGNPEYKDVHESSGGDIKGY